MLIKLVHLLHRMSLINIVRNGSTIHVKNVLKDHSSQKRTSVNLLTLFVRPMMMKENVQLVLLATVLTMELVFLQVQKT